MCFLLIVDIFPDKELLLQMENNNGISPNCDYSAVINSYYAEVASDDYWFVHLIFKFIITPSPVSERAIHQEI